MDAMSLEEVRRRLEALNRGPLPPAEPSAGAGASEEGAVPQTQMRPHSRRPGNGLEDLIDGEELTVGGERCFRVLRRLSRCWTADPQIGATVATAIESAASRQETLDVDLAAVARGGPGSLLFLDTETCGFAGTPLFLIGVMFPVDGDLHVEQVLARTYEEEPAIVSRLAQLIVARPVLVTFNGKSFDWPFVRDRAAVAGVDLADPQAHCDVLYAARRRYRDLLPDCKLQTLETHVCRRRRMGDIPGSEIPRAYHEFVRTQDARELREIVHHNFLDLVTLAEVTAKLLMPV
ncbi:MAG TPA: ribonuclease H-like domain-containing protein [Phycisphaerae bacterium]|nr:ribonuclease H-like domain-containing protein [Phycisphaerae bacterium]